MEEWLSHPELLDGIRQDLEELRTRCGKPGSAVRAAEALWKELA